jgi:hypothetical protein
MIEFDRIRKYMEDDEYEGCNCSDFESLITITRPYEIFPDDLDKRASAMLSILSNPKSNRKYSTNQADRLCSICRDANRQDLVTIIQEAMI